jgi:hypothetical protein
MLRGSFDRVSTQEDPSSMEKTYDHRDGSQEQHHESSRRQPLQVMPQGSLLTVEATLLEYKLQGFRSISTLLR